MICLVRCLDHEYNIPAKQVRTSIINGQAWVSRNHGLWPMANVVKTGCDVTVNGSIVQRVLLDLALLQQTHKRKTVFFT